MDPQEEQRLLYLYKTVEIPSEMDSESAGCDHSDKDPEFIPEICDEQVSNDDGDTTPDEEQTAPKKVAQTSSWKDPIQNRVKNIIYNADTEEVGVNPDLIETMQFAPLYDFFSIFVDDEIIDLLVRETNRFVEWKLNGPNVSRRRQDKKLGSY